MTDIKKKVEQYFIDNWVKTPIQFEGTSFVAPKRWIKLNFYPLDRKITAFNGTDEGLKSDTMLLKVSVFDESATLSMMLEDDVRTLLECKTIDKYRTGVGQPSGDGAVPLENDVWVSVSTYDILSYN